MTSYGVRREEAGKRPRHLFVKFSVGKQQRRKMLGRVVAGNLQSMRLAASAIVAKAHLGVDVVAEAQKAQQEAAQQKTMRELVPNYLTLREKGDEFWRKLRPKIVLMVRHFLGKSWKPLHAEPVDKIASGKWCAAAGIKSCICGAFSANRAHTALSTFFRLGDRSGAVTGANPTADIKALPQQKRERYFQRKSWWRSVLASCTTRQRGCRIRDAMAMMAIAIAASLADIRPSSLATPGRLSKRFCTCLSRPKATFVARLQPSQFPSQAARQLPDPIDNCPGGTLLH